METIEIEEVISVNKKYQKVKNLLNIFEKGFITLMIIGILLGIEFIVVSIYVDVRNNFGTFSEISWLDIIIYVVIVSIIRYFSCYLVKIYLNLKRDSLCKYSDIGYKYIFRVSLSEPFQTSFTMLLNLTYLGIAFLSDFSNRPVEIVIILIVLISILSAILFQIFYIYEYKVKIDIAIKTFTERGDLE